MENRYIDYTGEAMITVPKRKLYTDSEGFPNENAFRDFADPPCFAHLGWKLNTILLASA